MNRRVCFILNHATCFVFSCLFIIFLYLKHEKIRESFFSDRNKGLALPSLVSKKTDESKKKRRFRGFYFENWFYKKILFYLLRFVFTMIFDIIESLRMRRRESRRLTSWEFREKGKSLNNWCNVMLMFMYALKLYSPRLGTFISRIF